MDIESVRAPARVVATPEALEAIKATVGERGPLMFFQSGGCCDGSLPLCFLEGEFVVGNHDVLLGSVGGCPFYIDHRQFERWRSTQIIMGVSEGEPEGFSLGAGHERHFSITSRVFENREVELLAVAEDVTSGHIEPATFPS